MEPPFQACLEHFLVEGPTQESLHRRAAAVALADFGKRVFIRAVIEVSNYCRENCRYCGMRRDNRALARYRAHYEQLAETLLQHRPPSVTDLNIQAGEDPVAVREVVLPLIQTLRAHTPLGLSVCLGTLPSNLYQSLHNAGASIYIMKFETANRDLYKCLEAPGTAQERLNHIQSLAALGWHVSSGFIVGLPGETQADRLANLQLAATLPLMGCSVSPFIPGESTPLAKAAPANINLALNAMALLRLTRPHWIIPAVSALNLAGSSSPVENGYRRGLRTGANLVTMNLTPSEFREDYLLYKRDRVIMTEERILGAIAAEGLEPSHQSLAAYCAQRHSPSPMAPHAQALPGLYPPRPALSSGSQSAYAPA